MRSPSSTSTTATLSGISESDVAVARIVLQMFTIVRFWLNVRILLLLLVDVYPAYGGVGG